MPEGSWQHALRMAAPKALTSASGTAPVRRVSSPLVAMRDAEFKGRGGKEQPRTLQPILPRVAAEQEETKEVEDAAETVETEAEVAEAAVVEIEVKMVVGAEAQVTGGVASGEEGVVAVEAEGLRVVEMAEEAAARLAAEAEAEAEAAVAARAVAAAERERAWAEACEKTRQAVLASRAHLTFLGTGAACPSKYRNVSSALLQVPTPSEGLPLRRQLEYYFSDANLCKDAFLQQKLREATGGWVGADIIAIFPRVQALVPLSDDEDGGALVQEGCPSMSGCGGDASGDNAAASPGAQVSPQALKPSSHTTLHLPRTTYHAPSSTCHVPPATCHLPRTTAMYHGPRTTNIPSGGGTGACHRGSAHLLVSPRSPPSPRRERRRALATPPQRARTRPHTDGDGDRGEDGD